MKLPPEANLLAVAHYLEALDFSKEIVKFTPFSVVKPASNWLRWAAFLAPSAAENGRGRRSEYGTPELCQFHHPKSSPVLRTGLSSGRLADCQLLQRLGKNRRRVIEHGTAGLWRFRIT